MTDQDLNLKQLGLLHVALERFDDESRALLPAAGTSKWHYTEWRETTLVWKAIGSAMRDECERLGLPEEAYPLPPSEVLRGDHQFLDGALERISSLYTEALGEQDIFTACILDAARKAVKKFVEANTQAAN